MSSQTYSSASSQCSCRHDMRQVMPCLSATRGRRSARECHSELGPATHELVRSILVDAQRVGDVRRLPILRLLDVTDATLKPSGHEHQVRKLAAQERLCHKRGHAYLRGLDEEPVQHQFPQQTLGIRLTMRGTPTCFDTG